MSHNFRQLVPVLALVSVAAVTGAAAASLLSIGAHTASPAQAPSGQLAELRSEVHALRRQVGRAAAAPARSPSPVSGNVLSAPATAEAVPRPLAFEKERIDRSWAEPTEDAVRELFASLRGLSEVEAIECRTQSCRARFAATEMPAVQQLEVEAVRELGASAVVATSLPDRSDAYEVTFVLPRQ